MPVILHRTATTLLHSAALSTAGRSSPPLSSFFAKVAQFSFKYPSLLSRLEVWTFFHEETNRIQS